MRLLLASYILASALLAESPLPVLQSRVTDAANALTQAEETQLEARLERLEKEKGSQVVVVIINSTDGEAIEQYSMRLAEAWKIGRKGVDDGVILLVAKQDRKIRMEVGYGLEGAIPDAQAKRIIDLIIVPKLREGNFYQGIMDGVEAIAQSIGFETLPPAAAPVPPASAEPGFLDQVREFFIMSVFRFMRIGKWLLMGLGIWILFARKSLAGLGLVLAGQLLMILPIQIMYGFFSLMPGFDLIIYTAAYLIAYGFVNRNRSLPSSSGESSSSGSSYSYKPYTSSTSSSRSSSSSRSTSSGSSSRSSSSSSSSSSRSYSGGGGSFGGGGASSSW